MTILKICLRWILGIFFVAAGAMHFQRPAAYLSIMPPFLPLPLLLIYVSGAAECLGGLGLLVPVSRRWAAWGLVALLICVFPANIYMLLARTPILGMHPPLWLLWLRLPMQGVLVAAVLWVARSDVILPARTSREYR